MLTKEKRETSVVATSPFLSLEQAAGELRTTVVHLMRLIARGFLVAVQAGDTWRVRPADLDVYAKMGSADFDAPKFDNDGVWFGDNDNHGFAARFQDSVRKLIRSAFPEELPRDAKGKPQTSLTLPVAGELATLLRSPALKPVIVITGEKPYDSRFDLAVEQYAGDKLRWLLQQALKQNSLSAESILSGKTDLMKLYASPEEYKRRTTAAVQTFSLGSINWSREYPHTGASGVPGTVTVTIKVPHTSLGVDLTKVLRAAL